MEGRWSDRADAEVSSRAFREAAALGHSWCGVDHVLLAVLNPPLPTDAAAVLSELGLTRAAAEERLAPRWSPAEGDGAEVLANPAFHSLLGQARGLALGEGASTVTDKHVLLALAYGGRHSLLVALGETVPPIHLTSHFVRK